MAVKYLASKRITGTNAERTASSLPAGIATGWKLVDRTSLSSADDDIHVSSLANKRYYMTLTHLLDNGSAIDAYFRFNDDTGNNYYNRQMQRGGSDSTNTTDGMTLTGGSASDIFGVQYISNKADKQKLMINPVTFYGGGTSAGTAVDKYETVGLWNESSNAINKITTHNYSAGSYNTDSEVVVLGYDPTDTASTDTWEELYSGDLSGGEATDLTATITAKKYLWIQFYVERNSAADIQPVLQFNSDGGSNYAFRISTNGSEQSFTSKTRLGAGWMATNKLFCNVFLVNPASTEKLSTWWGVGNNTSGAGTAPDKILGNGKWTNTSDQITTVKLFEQDGYTFSTNTTMKIWGFD